MNRLETISAASCFLSLFDHVAGEFNFAAALNANEVVVVRMAEDMFEPAVERVVRNAADQAAVLHQRQVAVESGF